MPDGYGNGGAHLDVPGTLTRDDRRGRELMALHLRFEHGMNLNVIARTYLHPSGGPLCRRENTVRVRIFSELRPVSCVCVLSDPYTGVLRAALFDMGY